MYDRMLLYFYNLKHFINVITERNVNRSTRKNAGKVNLSKFIPLNNIAEGNMQMDYCYSSLISLLT